MRPVFLTFFSLAYGLAEEGILISGGYPVFTSVEVLFPSTNQSCSLPSLPDGRYDHTMDTMDTMGTMDSLLLCGGSYSPTTCLTFSSGKWINTTTLAEERADHSSWQSEQGLVLMGGYTSPNTSEIVRVGAEQGEPSFPMYYSTSGACAVADPTTYSVVITGGLNYMNENLVQSTVSRYGMLGLVENLHDLVVARRSHGCGSYFRTTDGTQVLMVVGGTDGYDIISSTEILTSASGSWSVTTPLPGPRYYLKCLTTGGKLFATGGFDDTYVTRDEVFAWFDEGQEWAEMGRMKVARRNHAVTTIMMDDPAMEYCG